MRKIALAALSSLFILPGLFLLLMFYERYWRWRGCFNELGRCFDPVTQDVYLEQSGLVFGGLAAILLFLGAILLLRGLRPGHDGVRGHD